MSSIDDVLYNQNFQKFITLLTDERLKIEDTYTYNIFKTLKLETDETRLHSAFIADLLNPNGFHKKKGVFLDLFLENICGMKLNNSTKFENTHVDVEYPIGEVVINTEPKESKGGRIDILINDRSDNSFIIAIENKIYAEDQRHQIIRYHNFLKGENYSEKRLIYLTLFGDNPSELSIDKYDTSFFKDTNLMNISYESDIIPWLEKCKNFCSSGSDKGVYDAIIQYQGVLKQLIESSIITLIRSKEMNDAFMNADILRTIKILHRDYNAIAVEIIKEIVGDVINKLSIKTSESAQCKNLNLPRNIKIDETYTLRFTMRNNVLFYGISCSENKNSDKSKMILELINKNKNVFVEPLEKNSDEFLLGKKTDIALSTNDALCKNLQEETKKIVDGCNYIIECIQKINT